MADAFTNRPANRTAKVIQIGHRTTVDTDGVVQEEEYTKVTRLPQEPPYVKLYLEDIAKLMDVPEGPRAVLLALVRKLDFEGIISLTPAARERLCAQLNIKVTTFNNYLVVLCQREILKRLGRGEYEMNPNILARGDWIEIQKRRTAFKLTVTYRPDGTKEISGGIDPEPELPLEAWNQAAE